VSDQDLVYVEVGDQLVELSRSEFAKEIELQRLIASRPDLLSGSQLDPDDPVRWLLVTQEAGIPDCEGGGNRWSVDHLLIDQHGRPTFVEVKRSSDTRIRREVVGQLLEYAANATEFWPMSRIRELASIQHGSEDALDEAVAAFADQSLVNDDGVHPYWARVRENLEQGRVRLLFVADVIPPQLRRIIEFLNDHMGDVDVLGVEIGHYSDGANRAFVPRVVGQTEKARSRKSELRRTTEGRGRTNEVEFLGQLGDSQSAGMVDILREAERRELQVYWGVKGLSIRIVAPRWGGNAASVFYAYPPGANGREHLHLQGYLAHVPATEAAQVRDVFISQGGMTARTKKTLHVDIDADERAGIDAAGSALWAVVDLLMKTSASSDAEREPVA
jgi:hypothetical protein